MQPGECRILKRSLKMALPENELFSLLKAKGRHYYFYWMLHDKEDISSYERSFNQRKQRMYDSLIQLIQDSCPSEHQPDELG